MMGAGEWSKIITAFIACAIKPGLVGLPATVFAFHFSFLKTLLVGGSAGICGSVVFGFLSDEVIYLYRKFLDRYFPRRQKKKFTRSARFLIGFKRYFGIKGMAIIAPLIMSIPLGSFLAIRFFGHRNKTILYMSISSVLLTIILYFTYNGFYDKLVDLFK
jgi:hypothetical protein